MKASIDNIVDAFSAVPYASVDSNVPYASGSRPQDASERRSKVAEFIDSSDQSWPEINFPQLRADELWSSERAMQALLGELDTQGDLIEEVDIVYEQIAVKLAELYRHLEVVRGLGSTGLRREVSRERAGEMSMEIYGRPDERTFNAFMSKDVDNANRTDGDVAVQVIRSEYLALVGDRAKSPESKDGGTGNKLTDRAMETIKSDIYELYPDLEAATTTDQEVITAAESGEYFAHALEALGLSEKGWRFELVESGSAETRGSEQRIVVGKTRADFTKNTLKGVVTHEVLHALRAQNAADQETSYRRRSLHGNTAFEEGFCTGIEQIVMAKRRDVGVPFYVSLGLQLGMDKEGGGKRDFRETHEIMWRRLLLDQDTVTDQAIRDAKRKALTQTMRTARGNSLDARDISYANGSQRANQWLNSVAELDETERKEKLQWVLSGKFDPTIDKHMALFSQKNEQQDEVIL